LDLREDDDGRGAIGSFADELVTRGTDIVVMNEAIAISQL
jgi:hypothetical protein